MVDGLDIMIVRELTGGVYFGEPKTITDLGNGQKRAIDTQVYDTYEIERIAPRRLRAGAQAPQQGHLDGEAQRHEDRRALERGGRPRCITREFKDVELEHQLADAGGMQLVRWPKQFDVIVTDNLFGDMLSDVAAMLTGSLGMLPSASLGETDPKTEQAQGAVRAGARLGARHRRQGHRQPDRDDRLVRHGAALFVRHGQGGRPDRPGDRRDARQGPAHRRHQVGRLQARQHRRRWATRSSARWRSSRPDGGRAAAGGAAGDRDRKGRRVVRRADQLSVHIAERIRNDEVGE